VVVAVDLGFGWTKALTRSRVFIEPSVVGPAEAIFEGLTGTPQGIRLWEGDSSTSSATLRFSSVVSHGRISTTTSRVTRTPCAC